MQFRISVQGLSRGRFGSFRSFGIGATQEIIGFWLGSFDFVKEISRTTFLHRFPSNTCPDSNHVESGLFVFWEDCRPKLGERDSGRAKRFGRIDAHRAGT